MPATPGPGCGGQFFVMLEGQELVELERQDNLDARSGAER